MAKGRERHSKVDSLPKNAQPRLRRTDLRPRRSACASKGKTVLEAGADGSSTNGNSGAKGRKASESGKRKARNELTNKEDSFVNGLCATVQCKETTKRSRRHGTSAPAPPQNPINSDPVLVSKRAPQSTEEYPYVPGLADDLALLCLARVPRSDHERFRTVNRKFSALTESGDLFKVRRRNGIVEQWVYMVASGQLHWQSFDPKGRKWRRLPPFEADYCYHSSDKESFSVGTQLLVVGRNACEGLVIWRYDLISNQWAKGSMMHTPRCLYGWASCGQFAYVAGGLTLSGELLQSAERYDPDCEQWKILPAMNQCRKFCSGCFMDGKFYVIGGEGVDGYLTSAEVYDPITKTWTVIPDMLPRESTPSFSGAPPLIAVVKNELYALEAESNQLKVYLKKSNSWKVLGEAPVRADLISGWGVAFKSLGEQLLVIGGARTPEYEDGMYVCRPDPAGGQLQWDFLSRLCPFGPFVLNCAIVSA